MTPPEFNPQPAAAEPAAAAHVRAAQQRLGDLEGAPVAAHIQTYDDVHAALQGALAELDEA